MKHYFNRICSFIIAMTIFLSYSITAYALPKRLLDGTWIDVPLSEYGEEISYFIQYGLSQIGVFIHGGDFEQWLKNNETYQDLYDDNGRLAKNISIDTSTGKVTYTKEIMQVLKNAADDYAKNNEPYEMWHTFQFSTLSASVFGNAKQYNTVKNMLKDSKSGVLAVSPGFIDNQSLYAADIGSVFKNISPVMGVYGLRKGVCFYDNETWNQVKLEVKKIDFSGDTSAFSSSTEFFNAAKSVGNVSAFETRGRNYENTYFGGIHQNNYLNLVTEDDRRIRVYKTYGDFQNYTVGKRKVYYTSNYYNYVPEDLTVSIDDLEKEIDDLSKVIDQLLGQISKDTDESEIEDLLRQILDELKNNPGGGGSGGDVNVDIDLSTTNGLLSKILAKVTQIFDKLSDTATDTFESIDLSTTNGLLSQILDKATQIFDKLSETASGTVDTVNTKLQETLDEILSTLRTISGDVSDIKGQLENMSEQEFNEKSDSFLGEIMDAFSEISEVVKTKFPFSIPNDLRIFLSKIALAPPETEEQQIESYSFDTSSGISLYSGEDGGGGGSRDPVEMREAPVFRLPIVIERYGIEEYIIIDMSSFDPLSRFSRSFFTIIFMVCLFNLTFKVIGMWGDLIG